MCLLVVFVCVYMRLGTRVIELLCTLASALVYDVIKQLIEENNKFIYLW